MEDLKLILINQLKSKGIDPALIPAYLKALTSLISSEPRVEPAQINQKLHSLGWDEVARCLLERPSAFVKKQTPDPWA